MQSPAPAAPAPVGLGTLNDKPVLPSEQQPRSAKVNKSSSIPAQEAALGSAQLNQTKSAACGFTESSSPFLHPPEKARSSPILNTKRFRMS